MRSRIHSVLRGGPAGGRPVRAVQSDHGPRDPQDLRERDLRRGSLQERPGHHTLQRRGARQGGPGSVRIVGRHMREGGLVFLRGVSYDPLRVKPICTQKNELL